jgi:hypothetical protein
MGLGPGRKLRDHVDPAKELADHLAGIVALTENIEVGQQALECVFGLRDGDVRVVFALTLQASMMFEQLFPVELTETLTGRSAERPGQAGNLDTLEATLHGHVVWSQKSV